jgi:catechol 2,3-dioxygenase-like lactoylglutathione lyase family enzyme
MHIDHINIAAPLALLEQVREFYCATLELEVGPRPDFGIAGYWLYCDNHALIHLIESPNHQRGDAPYHLDHVAFAVSGLEAYTGRLDALNVPYSVNHIKEFGVSQVFCHDPCGIGVEANFNHEKDATEGH